MRDHSSTSLHDITRSAEDERQWLSNIEAHAQGLRQCAKEMIEFIDGLTTSTNTLCAIKDAYVQLETMPVQSLPQGIDAVTQNFKNLAFFTQNESSDHISPEEITGFFEKQNKFNAEAQALVAYAMGINHG